MKKVLIINGPNLNLLGKRNPAIYGNKNYSDLIDMIKREGDEMGVKTDFFQSNHEGAIIDRIQEAVDDGTDGVIINPGAYTHYSYAIHDALEILTVPIIEVHISDINSREDFRKVSVIRDVCAESIIGEGLEGYIKALRHLGR